MLCWGGLAPRYPPLRETSERARVTTGLAVHVGAEDLSTAKALKEAGTSLVLVVVDDASTGCVGDRRSAGSR